jgi:hypothetical protein
MRSSDETQPTGTTWQTRLLRLTGWTLLGLLILSFINPFTHGYWIYPFEWYRCGIPPVVASSFMGDHSYYTPSMKAYSSNVSWPVDHYYCTESEAQTNGYRKSPSL